jgi:hypothetical protein
MTTRVHVKVASFEMKSIKSTESWMAILLFFVSFAWLYLQVIFGTKQECMCGKVN